jgi:hypothetical protein
LFWHISCSFFELNFKKGVNLYEKIKSFIEAKGVSTENMSYQDVITYNTGSKVLIDGVCSPTDCMEDLNIGFYLFQALESEE